MSIAFFSISNVWLDQNSEAEAYFPIFDKS